MKSKTIVLGLALLPIVSVAATPPDAVHYQGVLRDASDQPLTGNYDMVFRFFDAQTAGNEIMIDRHLAAGTGAVTASGGLFSTALGGGAVSDGSGPGTYTSLAKAFADFGNVWLGIEVQGQTLTPRVRLLASPYALNATNLDGKAANTFVDTSGTAQSKTGNLAVGNLTANGTLTVTGGGPAAGRVLTSDATGLASWRDPAVSAQEAALGDLADRLRTVDPATLPFGDLGKFNCTSTAATLAFSIDGVATGNVAGFVGIDRLASPFEYVIALDSAAAIDAESQLGRVGRLTVARASGSTTYSGRITEFGLAAFAGGTRTYVVRLEPTLSNLMRRADYELFQGLSVTQVIQKVLTDAAVTASLFQLASTYPPLDMTVQYDENDLDFVRRLVENEGLSFHFRELAAGDQVVFSDDNAAFVAIPGSYAYRGDLVDPGTGEEYVRTFHTRSRRFSAVGRVRGYNLITPTAPAEQTSTAVGGDGERYEAYAEDIDASRALARAQQIIERDQVHRLERSGTSNIPELRAGRTFTLSDSVGAGFGGSYAVTEVVHFALRDPNPACIGYGNVFSAIPSTTRFRPERVTRKPVVRGSTVAKVTGPLGNTEFTDTYGRVKVKFFWDRTGTTDENSSGWVRVAVPSGRIADRRWVPKIGDEVLVDFLDGDPDRPVVLGSPYNADRLPPATDSMTLGGDLTVSGNDLVFGAGGRLTGTTGSTLETLGDSDTDDLLLLAGNTVDDGAIRVFGDSTFELRSGSGLFSFINGASGLETAQVDASGNLQFDGHITSAGFRSAPTGRFDFTAVDTGFATFLDQTSATINEWKIGGANFDLYLGDSAADNVFVPGDLSVTGVKNFVQNHPQRADLSVVYTALEGDEAGTYTRGSARLVDGVARVALGETFAWVTNPDIGLTAQLTARGAAADLYVESLTTKELVVRARLASDAEAAFDYLVHGLRIGYEEYGVLQPRRMDGSIPVRVSRAADGNDLHALDALTRFRTMETALGRRAPEQAGADALRAAIGEHADTDDLVSIVAAPATTVRPEHPVDPADITNDGATAIPTQDATASSAAPTPVSRFASAVCVAGFTPGDLVAIDRDQPSHWIAARRIADPAVVGVLMLDPLAACAEGELVIAFAGIVTAKVDASFGAIEIGDLLTSSPTPGHAMRAGTALPGTIVGKALEPLASGVGTIRVLVMPR
ncbi:MAG: type VI secretion system tip protein TssI/VgrG [Acidobacteriota bacterium]